MSIIVDTEMSFKPIRTHQGGVREMNCTIIDNYIDVIKDFKNMVHCPPNRLTIAQIQLQIVLQLDKLCYPSQYTKIAFIPYQFLNIIRHFRLQVW